jgi:hypothetical protein
MRLFGRKWKVTIDRVLIEDLDVAFTIERSLKPEPNTCELTVWNLNTQQRAKLEELRPKKGSLVGIPVKIEAGYEVATTLIWLGDLRTVETRRIEADWVTTLGSGDGEKAIGEARINQSFGLGTNPTVALRALAKAMGVGPGNLEFFAQKLLLTGNPLIGSQGIVLSGSAPDQLTDWTRSLDLEWSVQDGALQFTDRGKPLIGSAILLTKETGLVDSPTVDQDGILYGTSLMVPGMLPGTLAVIKSDRVIGNYRLTQVRYQGDTAGTPWYADFAAERF